MANKGGAIVSKTIIADNRAAMQVALVALSLLSVAAGSYIYIGTLNNTL